MIEPRVDITEIDVPCLCGRTITLVCNQIDGEQIFFGGECSDCQQSIMLIYEKTH